MESGKLKEHLIRNTTKLYCVLDGASVPDLPNLLYRAAVPHVCLMQGETRADMLYVAPYLVFLQGGEAFTDTVLDNSDGKHWGIFAHSRHSMNEMRRHFSSLLSIYDEQGNPLLFRYYDPRVLRKFLPMCNGGELKTFFGKVESFFAETEDGAGMTSFSLADDALKTAELN